MSRATVRSIQRELYRGVNYCSRKVFAQRIPISRCVRVESLNRSEIIFLNAYCYYYEARVVESFEFFISYIYIFIRIIIILILKSMNIEASIYSWMFSYDLLLRLKSIVIITLDGGGNHFAVSRATNL